MPGRSLGLFCFTAVTFVLACDRVPVSEDPPTAVTIIVTGPDGIARVGASAMGTADRRIAGPSAQGTMPGMSTPGDPILTLFAPAESREVTLAPGIGSAGRKVWATPTMNLFGSAEQPWRVQVGPRMTLGRNSGLLLRGGTQGQHNRWDLGASATVGARPNVQGVVRYHP
jgi:hypothetical protein